jgi:hypothetical protein
VCHKLQTAASGEEDRTAFLAALVIAALVVTFLADHLDLIDTLLARTVLKPKPNERHGTKNFL